MEPRTNEDHRVSAATAEQQQLGAYLLGPVVASDPLSRVHLASRGAQGAEGRWTCLVQRLQSAHVSDAELREHLLVSGRVGAAVRAEQIASISGVHTDPEPYLVLETGQAWSLQALIERSSRPERTRYLVPLLVDVLEGLRALHEHCDEQGRKASLVHGAPSARHVLVGSDGVARLFDFAHAVSLALPWRPRRDEFLVASEMAPEQALAPAHVDARCDLFIVGATLFELLCGFRLFPADGAEVSLHGMLRRAIPVPSELGSEAGRSFDRICVRALQRARTERFSTAQQFADALREALHGSADFATRDEVVVWLSKLGPIAMRDGKSALCASRSTIEGLGPVVIREVVAAPRSPQKKPATERVVEGGVSALSALSSARSAPVEGRGDCVAPGGQRDHSGYSAKRAEDRSSSPRPSSAPRAESSTTLSPASVLDMPIAWREPQASVPPYAAPSARSTLRMAATGVAIGALMVSALLFIARQDAEIGRAREPAVPAAHGGESAIDIASHGAAASSPFEVLRRGERVASEPSKAPSSARALGDSQRPPRKALAQPRRPPSRPRPQVARRLTSEPAPAREAATQNPPANELREDPPPMDPESRPIPGNPYD